jgi:hypothetical protein
MVYGHDVAVKGDLLSLGLGQFLEGVQKQLTVNIHGIGKLRTFS